MKNILWVMIISNIANTNILEISEEYLGKSALYQKRNDVVAFTVSLKRNSGEFIRSEQFDYDCSNKKLLNGDVGVLSPNMNKSTQDLIYNQVCIKYNLQKHN
jgi:hypothetical protein